MRQLSELFVELATLIDAQDEPLRLIDAQMEQTQTATEAARRELEKTAKTQGECSIC